MNMPGPNIDEETIYINSRNQIQIIKLSDVIYIQADGNYSRFKLKQGKDILVCQQLKVMEKYLIGFDFIRCHRSYLIRLSMVKKIVKHKLNYTILIDKEVIPISRRKAQEFIWSLKIYTNSTAYTIKHTVY